MDWLIQRTLKSIKCVWTLCYSIYVLQICFVLSPIRRQHQKILERNSMTFLFLFYFFWVSVWIVRPLCGNILFRRYIVVVVYITFYLIKLVVSCAKFAQLKSAAFDFYYWEFKCYCDVKNKFIKRQSFKFRFDRVVEVCTGPAHDS